MKKSYKKERLLPKQRHGDLTNCLYLVIRKNNVMVERHGFSKSDTNCSKKAAF